MKKSLILGICFVVLGIVLFIAGFFIANQDFSVLDIDAHGFVIDTGTGEPEKIKYSATELPGEGISEIVIKSASPDILITASEDENIYINHTDSDRCKFTVTTGETLKIEQGPNDLSFHFGFDFDDIDSFVHISIPRGMLNGELSLSISTASGDVEIRPDMTFGVISISTASGDVDIGSIQCESITVSTTSGDVETDSITASLISVSTVSGEQEYQSITCDSADISTTSGDIEFDRLAAKDKIELESVSGEVSGRLSGTLEDYSVTSDTTSGENTLPGRYDSGGCVLNVSTTSGDIDVRFIGK